MRAAGRWLRWAFWPGPDELPVSGKPDWGDHWRW
jgi:hypothetical protein